ncbi:unnamed protein product [Tuber melanosporum]|uniref:(Perigord truffle) hypothetical protein n=1 Tax=Tuber melanosporum (strain Mel28) TaxID=656061 RepID=D5GFF9_TUBMM|nr:uncharacterized protein GSTUM_00006873001 [Tuber melanosporum]CAZ83252.1 unnamed protein product [Tuber melanosporum]
MNNAQFRKLLETPRPANASSQNGPSSTPALGSKLRPSIPMTPRSVLGGSSTQSEFARQLAANNASEQKTKKFRSSAAPLGTRLPEGYVDRTKDREDDGGDERDRRLAALEELYKEGGIEHEEYVRQTKLLGGDVSSTHLVKGLDFRLLEKVRRGEDVMRVIRDDEGNGAEEGRDSEGEEDVLDKVLEKDVVPGKKEEKKKKGNLAPKTRAEILAELRRSREAAKPVSMLGSKFKKIGVKEERKEENGAKVKYVTGADGVVKKMIKKDKKDKKCDKPEPVSTRVMGMMPPPPMPGKTEKAEEEDEDIDIFEGAGTEYNPLAGLDDDDASSSSSSEEEGEEEIHPTKKAKSEKVPESPPKPPSLPTSPLSSPSVPPPPPPAPKPKANYFNEPTTTSSDIYKPPFSASALLSSNPELAAALAKASTIKAFSTPSEDEAGKRRKALLEAADRDAFDIDFGFGGSRDFGDEDDDDGTVAKSSGGKKRKRGGKPKKGDKNNAGIVGKIVEERYGSGSKK